MASRRRRYRDGLFALAVAITLGAVAKGDAGTGDASAWGAEDAKDATLRTVTVIDEHDSVARFGPARDDAQARRDTLHSEVEMLLALVEPFYAKLGETAAKLEADSNNFKTKATHTQIFAKETGKINKQYSDEVDALKGHFKSFLKSVCQFRVALKDEHEKSAKETQEELDKAPGMNASSASSDGSSGDSSSFCPE